MKKYAIFLADGFEEIEGLTVVDVLRRAQVTIDMISLGEQKRVEGSHGIHLDTDGCIQDLNWEDYEGIILPGGMPGTTHLGQSQKLIAGIQDFARQGKLLAAICAAPSVLEQAGVLTGKDATSYPSVEEKMCSCHYREDRLVRDGNIITSRAMGTSLEFALAILTYIKGEEASQQIARSILFDS